MQQHKGKLEMLKVIYLYFLCYRLVTISLVMAMFNYYLVFFCSGGDGTSNTEPNSKKDQLVLDICVICLEQEYNAVFVP
jgi:hypothetical protein